MAGQRGLHGDACGFDVTDFTDHDGVRVMTQDRTQRRREGEADVGMYLKLGDARNVVFHRVFHGEHPLMRRIAGDQGGIKRGAFAGTRRAGHQYDAIGLLHPAAIQVQVVRFNAEIVQVKTRCLRIGQQTQHQRFAMHAGNHRDAHIGIDPGGTDRKASVLRQAALSNIQAGNQLDAADHGMKTVALIVFRQLQLPVNAVANGKAGFVRLQMYVGSAGVGCPCHHTIDQFDHRRVFRHLAQVGRAFVGLAGAIDLGQDPFKITRGDQGQPIGRCTTRPGIQIFKQGRVEDVTAGDDQLPGGLVLPGKE